MSKTTLIEFADHTWSMWRGCEQASLTDGTKHPGCTNCYAEVMSHRNPAVLGEWGPDRARPIGAENYLKLPYQWNQAAKETGERRRVFPSLMDPFENRPDLADFRHGLFRTIDACPHLDFLLFTKRANKIRDLWPGTFRHNVWLVYSASDQRSLDDGVPHLLQCRDLAPILGLSAEPLLGPLDLTTYLASCECNTCCNGEHPGACRECAGWGSNNEENPCSYCLGDGTCPVCAGTPPPRLDWVIPGAESGPKARPCDVTWIRSIVQQAQSASVPVFVKQVGAKPIYQEIVFDTDRGLGGHTVIHTLEYITHPKGGDMMEWPPDLRVRQFPHP